MKILKLGQMLGGSNAPSGAGFENLYSLDFDGVNDYVNIANITESQGIDSLSVSAWVKPAAELTNMIIAKHAGGTSGSWYLAIPSADTFRFVILNASSTRVEHDVSYTITLGQWYHLVGVYNGTDIKLYINGVETGVASSQTGLIKTVTTSVRIGTYQNNAWFFQGNIDEVALFDTDLSGAEASAIYNSGVPTDLSGESDLIGYWRNGDPNGTAAFPTITDDSSNSYNGTMTNMASGDIVTVVP